MGLQIDWDELFERTRHHRHLSEKEIALRSLAVQEEILIELRRVRRIIEPRIASIEIILGDDMATLTAKAVWSDGFVGFDGTHVQPADWTVIFTDTASEVTDNHDGTATVTGATADVVTATYDTFSATYDYTPPAPTITGLQIEVS